MIEAAATHDVIVIYCGLSSPELHLERVRFRVTHGGHDIPEAKIRERWNTSRLNLIRLLPSLKRLHVFDNSAPADADGNIPDPVLVLEMSDGTTAANEADVKQVAALLHGKEEQVWADSGDRGTQARVKRDVQWHIAGRASDLAKLPEGRAKARIRTKVEHPFGVIKCPFGLAKVRFKGLAKNTAHVIALFALSNEATAAPIADGPFPACDPLSNSPTLTRSRFAPAPTRTAARSAA